MQAWFANNTLEIKEETGRRGNHACFNKVDCLQPSHVNEVEGCCRGIVQEVFNSTIVMTNALLCLDHPDKNSLPMD